MDMEPGPTATVDEILAWLAANRSEDDIAGMARYGIETARAFGISNARLRPLARRIGRDHARALALWDSGWREARLLAVFTAEKKRMTLKEARHWADDFNSWEIVDGATSLFVDAGFADPLIEEFAGDDREFVRRAAFAMIAWAAVHQKKRPDSEIITYLALMEAHATDPRNFVKKAVNWALRSIGKRSLECYAPALALAKTLAGRDDRTARWIGRDAEKELTAEKTLERLKKKRTGT